MVKKPDVCRILLNRSWFSFRIVRLKAANGITCNLKSVSNLPTGFYTRMINFKSYCVILHVFFARWSVYIKLSPLSLRGNIFTQLKYNNTVLIAHKKEIITLVNLLEWDVGPATPHESYGWTQTAAYRLCCLKTPAFIWKKTIMFTQVNNKHAVFSSKRLLRDKHRFLLEASEAASNKSLS